MSSGITREVVTWALLKAHYNRNRRDSDNIITEKSVATNGRYDLHVIQNMRSYYMILYNKSSLPR